MKRICAALILLTSAAPLPLLAAEGRIPVWEPTTLSQPGTYFLTRDIAITSGDAITIQADNVILDLNGRTIRTTSGLGAMVAIASGSSGVTVKNGFTSGGNYGVFYFDTSAPVALRLENLRMENHDAGALVWGARYIEILSCHVEADRGRGFDVRGAEATFGARIEGNSVVDAERHGISLLGLEGGVVRGNSVTRCQDEDQDPSGIRVVGNASLGAGGNLIEGNTVSGCRTGIDISFNTGNLLLNNVVRNNRTGMLIKDDENQVEQNTISQNIVGVSVVGLHNVFDRNSIVGNSTWGMFFNPGGGGNAFRNNILRGNASGAVENTAGTGTDEGGNVY